MLTEHNVHLMFPHLGIKCIEMSLTILEHIICLKVILGSNEKNRTIAVVVINTSTTDGLNVTSERRKSVAVSKIGSNITAENLTNYLVNDLNIRKEKIRVTSIGKNHLGFNWLQYRISTPECNYQALMTTNVIDDLSGRLLWTSSMLKIHFSVCDRRSDLDYIMEIEINEL